jgi:hypothetical protein
MSVGGRRRRRHLLGTVSELAECRSFIFILCCPGAYPADYLKRRCYSINEVLAFFKRNIEQLLQSVWVLNISAIKNKGKKWMQIQHCIQELRSSFHVPSNNNTLCT